MSNSLLKLVVGKEIRYKPDGDKDEIYCDIGEFKRMIFLQGARVQLKKDRKAESQIRTETADRIFKGVEARIRGSYYISLENKPKVIQGLQALKKKEGL